MFSPETIKTNPGSSYEPDESPRCQTGLVSYCLALGIWAASPGLEVFSDLNEMAGLSDEEKRHVDMRRDKVADPSLWSKLQPRNGKTNGSDDNAQSYACQCVLADCPKVDCVALLRCMHCTGRRIACTSKFFSLVPPSSSRLYLFYSYHNYYERLDKDLDCRSWHCEGKGGKFK